MASEKEIQRWTLALKTHVPEAKVMGVIREGKGLLLDIRASPWMESKLLRAGAHAWSWNIKDKHIVQARVHFGKKSYWHWPIIALVVYILYDIHFTEAVGRWARSWQ